MKFKRIIVFVVPVFLLAAGIGPKENVNAAADAETEKTADFCLTETEEAYAKTIRGRSIKLGTADPEAYGLDENGLEYGTCMPFVNFIEYELGTNVDVINGDREEIYSKLQNREIDLMFGVPCGEDGTDGLWYAAAIAEKRLLPVVNRNSCRQETGMLSDIRAGLIKGSPESIAALPYLHSVRETVYFNTDEEMMEAIVSGTIDAAVITEDRCGSIYGNKDLEIIPAMQGAGYRYTVATAKSEYSALLSIFSRFLTQTEEGGDFSEAVEANRLRYHTEFFKEKEKKLIGNIAKRYDRINIYLSGAADIPMAFGGSEDVNGIYPDIISFFRQATGTDPVILSDKDEDLRVNDLAENKIQAYCGLVKTDMTVTEFDFSDGIYENSFVAAVKAENEELFSYDIREMTWGVAANAAPIFESSVFAGHLREYGSVEELLEAVDNGDVDGAVVKQTVIDGANLSCGAGRYKTRDDIRIPVYEYIAFCKDNAELNTCFNRLISWYRITHPDYGNSFMNAANENRNVMVSNHLDKVRAQKLLAVACAVAGALLLYAAAKTVILAKTRRLFSAKMRVVCPAGKASDMIELDLKKQIIRSANGFSVFNLPEKDRRAEYTVAELSRLTGVDFKAHYNRIAAEGKTDFENDFSIYSRDCRYSYREKGTITGSTVISVVTKVTDI